MYNAVGESRNVQERFVSRLDHKLAFFFQHVGLFILNEFCDSVLLIDKDEPIVANLEIQALFRPYL